MAGPMQLAELVCAKLTHDLSGLLGSLNGILELVAETSEGATDEVDLATKTAAEVVARLQLLRAAWGGVSDAMDLETLLTQTRGAIGSHRLRLDLHELAVGVAFPPAMARLLLNVVLLAGDAMPRGGVLALSGDPAGQVVAQIAGPNAAWPTGFLQFIADDTAAWAALADPRDLQAPLTALIARSTGIRLSLMMAAGPSTAGSPPPLLITPATK